MTKAQDLNVISPQIGYQMMALASPADIVIGGGAAGVGKTFTLLMETLRNIYIKNFGAVVFRRTSPMIRAEGGLWDASAKIFNYIQGATPIESRLEWDFGNNVKIKFSHLEYEKNIYDWQGSEIPLICFDELTHFTKKMFFYLLSRNRSTCGVRPYVRATCNPDPDSWVRDLIDWWIGPDGYPIPERQGVLRYFMVDKDQYVWGNSYEEVIAKCWDTLQPMIEKSGLDPKDFVKSLTFIGGSIYDNKELLKVNPQYLGNLNAQDEATKSQLLGGNWNVKVSHTDIYDFNKFADIFTNTHVDKQIAEAKLMLGNAYLMSKAPEAEVNRLKKLTKLCITADIALKGSDLLVAFAWEGRKLIDFIVYKKSNGPTVINAIKGLAIRHGIPNSEIYYDNDGVGGFVGGEGGFIDGAVEFKNGATPVNGEAYKNLKSQCYFRSGDAVSRGEYYVPEEVANRIAVDEITLKEALKRERKAIKRDKPDDDGKLQIIKKSDMKKYLGDKSPDFMDALMIREYVDIYEPIIHSTDSKTVQRINY